VWVPYTTFRYDWSVAEVGLSLAIVGALSIFFQGLLIRPVVARLGEARALTLALVIVLVAYVLYGLAWQGWMIYAVSVPFMAGMGLIGPSAQGLMSRSVPPNEQGLLQGAVASVVTASAIFGPLIANGLFAYFIGPRAPVFLPGVPFFSGAVLILVALTLTWRNIVGRQPARYPPADGVRELHHA
jgi:DHA1 family tetracycline resistance protein-like MFS transporter